MPRKPRCDLGGGKDVNLGVAKKPEQVHIEHRVPTSPWVCTDLGSGAARSEASTPLFPYFLGEGPSRNGCGPRQIQDLEQVEAAHGHMESRWARPISSLRLPISFGLVDKSHLFDTRGGEARCQFHLLIFILTSFRRQRGAK